VLPSAVAQVLESALVPKQEPVVWLSLLALELAQEYLLVWAH
jgi:hypothetical protein